MHIVPLDDPEAEGLFDGNISVFPKLDGMNAQMWFDGEIVRCGTRNQELCGTDKDGRGLWTESQANKYMLFFIKFPQLRLYGEWLVKHDTSYRMDAFCKFYCFDVFNELTQTYVPFSEYLDNIIGFDIDIIPLIMTIDQFPKKDIKNIADKCSNFLLPYENGVGEGVVVKRYDFVNKFGRTVWGKYVNEKKKPHTTTIYQSVATGGLYSSGIITSKEEDFETKVVFEFLKESVIQKRVVFILDSEKSTGWKREFISRLINLVWFDFISEEMYGLLEKHHNPVIDFKKLRRAVAGAIKETKPHLFKDV
jgi:hypothetical protein